MATIYLIVQDDTIVGWRADRLDAAGEAAVRNKADAWIGRRLSFRVVPLDDEGEELELAPPPRKPYEYTEDDED